MKCSCLYNTGVLGDSRVYEFQCEEEYSRWDASVHWIKQSIALVNQKLLDEGREGEGTYEDYKKWLDYVYFFKNKYGEKLVPPDIRHSLGTVEDGCGLRKTIWTVD